MNVRSTDRMTDLAEKAATLRALHHRDLLVLPNAWDAASARVVESVGFPAVATTSAAVAAVLGHPDGEGAPPEEMFAASGRIARAVAVPVTMDAEAGYGLSGPSLVDALLGARVVGCNLEDSDHAHGGLTDAASHAARLADVRAAADAAGVPLVINARVDVFLPTSIVPPAQQVAEAIRRARLYFEAGADCVYPIGVAELDTLRAFVDAVDGPVNGNSNAELSLPVLKQLGVARVSYGPRFHRTALAGFRAGIEGL